MISTTTAFTTAVDSIRNIPDGIFCNIPFEIALFNIIRKSTYMLRFILIMCNLNRGFIFEEHDELGYHQEGHYEKDVQLLYCRRYLPVLYVLLLMVDRPQVCDDGVNVQS
mmetsp:Transcript_14601/g.33972  ORF Transcript_14601/g.33972 Transcript_14601/m.33972 type:complete len:110 (+) Transcript_14601:395-724(+)